MVFCEPYKFLWYYMGVLNKQIFSIMSIVPTKSDLQSFVFESVNVRIVEVDGDPWFVATDVLAAIKSTTTLFSAKAVIEDGLGEGYVNNTPLKTSGGTQEVVILHEAAVTLLISRSRTQMGKAFNRHLHSVILPTIRKTGKFVAHPEFEAGIDNQDEILEAKKRELKQARTELLEMQILTTRSKTLKLKLKAKLEPIRLESTVPIEFNPSIVAWADSHLEFNPDSRLYVSVGERREGTLSCSYTRYCRANDLKALHFQRFSAELLKYLRFGKKWSVRRGNKDSVGTPILAVSFKG